MRLSLIILISALSSAFATDVSYRGTSYQTFETAPSRIKLLWKDENARLIRQLSVAQKILERQGKRPQMLMNGGIFEEGGIPSGLLVIDGITLRPLNLAAGRGNFFLQPNGVFYVDKANQAAVITSQEFVRLRPDCRLAVQSGPLLLRNQLTHPAFRENSSHRLHRNGVGVRADGTVIFAATIFGQKRYPTLYEFADFFRSLGCRDALFLDGDISQLEIDPKKPLVPGNHFATIFAVTEPD